jgi:hypothetical protein
MLNFATSPFKANQKAGNKIGAATCVGMAILLAASAGAQAQTSGSTNFALGKGSTASSSDSTARIATAAFDASSTSRWSSQYSDNQWISVDLGAAKTINRVVLKWETAYGKAFLIQTATNGSNWKTVYSTTTGTGGTADIKFTPVTARYVRLVGQKRGTTFGYSLYDFAIYNSDSTTTPTTPTPPTTTPTTPATPTTPTTGSGTRDPLKQPFASNSIWNMPIGSGAQYVPANLNTNFSSGAGMPQIDDEYIIMKPNAPMTTINYSSAEWSGANRCNATGAALISVPMPSDFIVPHSGKNASAAFLAADGRSIIQTQPLARCYAGAAATSYITFPTVDIKGDGIAGSHGGSYMSAIGGSIRIGEMRPGMQGPKHALKVNVYAQQALYKCSTAKDCYRWPASTADISAIGRYGTNGNNTNTAMKMGALLAIPASVTISSMGLETEPGKQLAWTMQNYGAYIVDDTGGPNFALNAEDGPDGSIRNQFKADYNIDIETWNPGGSAWSRDIQRIMKALNVVNNNSATSIGGGGTPRQPLAPAI